MDVSFWPQTEGRESRDLTGFSEIGFCPDFVPWMINI
jgi:hypothetical protein